MAQTIKLFFQGEKQFLELCHNKDADISQFTALIDQGFRLNTHDKVDHAVASVGMANAV